MDKSNYTSIWISNFLYINEDYQICFFFLFFFLEISRNHTFLEIEGVGEWLFFNAHEQFFGYMMARTWNDNNVCLFSASSLKQQFTGRYVMLLRLNTFSWFQANQYLLFAACLWEKQQILILWSLNSNFGQYHGRLFNLFSSEIVHTLQPYFLGPEEQ